MYEVELEGCFGSPEGCIALGEYLDRKLVLLLTGEVLENEVVEDIEEPWAECLSP